MLVRDIEFACRELFADRALGEFLADLALGELLADLGLVKKSSDISDCQISGYPINIRSTPAEEAGRPRNWCAILERIGRPSF